MCTLIRRSAVCIFCVAFLVANSGYCVFGQHGEKSVERNETICESVDVRNDVKNLRKLENCTVIEGFLKILLIEKPSHGQYDKISFPDLVEVTQYILLYRVFGLKSLSQLFPNLAVVRGQELFYHYALVIYETIDLEDIGLIGLTTIERGAVRIEKNPNLCYIHTVDWTKIASNMKMSDHFFKGNKKISGCPNVPPKNETCVYTTVDGVTAPRAWNMNTCQKMLDCTGVENCPSGMCSKGHCCNSKCVGGCYGPLPSECVACKDVVDYSKGYPLCIDRCFPGTYKFHNRRCLLDKECMDMHFFLSPSRNGSEAVCTPFCPPGTTPAEVGIQHQCIPCKDRCPKVCRSLRVDSVDAAQKLKGCTIIKGTLEIRIRSGSNIGKELEENLGQIEEVDRYVWIHASDALLSLNFFKSLKRINGHSLYKKKFALMVNENKNLESLFPENVARQLEIVNGGIFFHFNRKLCVSKIKDLENQVKMNESAVNDISESNNGDQMPCTYIPLNFIIYQVASRVAFLRWDNVKIPDQRNLLSYVIHYREAPVQNVSIYEARHACSEDLWKSKDVPNEVTKDAPLMEILVNLKPWTQYAVYIETYTLAEAKVGGISKLKYFRTAAATPTIPQNLVITNHKPKQLHLKWDPPAEPRGNVTHYEIYWRKRELNPKLYGLRNYCTEPVQREEANGNDEFDKAREEDEKNKYKDENCCECPKKKEKEKEEQKIERLMQIEFQNFLHTLVYIKRNDNKGKLAQLSNRTRLSKVRGRRSSPLLDTFVTNETLANATVAEYNTTNKDMEKGLEEKENVTELVVDNPYYRAVVYKREFVITNLGHYEDYDVQVIACQERDPRDQRPPLHKKPEKLCSSRTLAVARTMASNVADNINSSTISINVLKNRTGEVILKWQPPENPNGILITYEIIVKKSDISNVQAYTICITQNEFKRMGGHKLTRLDSGNYTFHIRATSLAGNGTWTDTKFFIIESESEKKMAEEMIIVVCLIVGVLGVVITGIFVWCVARRKFRKYPDIQNISANPEYMSNYEAYVADEWEVDRDKVKLLRELGQGSFGMVYEGIAKDLKDEKGEVAVAVKTVNSSATFSERMSFLNEASIMKAFVCTHVVRLLGVVSEGVSQGKPAYVIMELMSNGDLKNFLRMHRPDEEDNAGRSPPTLHRIMQMAGEIADGMAYLADKKFVHRDLAARNCMVSSNLTVKIGDFGMTRDIYETDYYRKGGKGLLPVRWMAPESLKDGIFTSMSDVWSYGVVIWEMATLAAQPYQGLSNEEVLKYVINAKTMDMPEGCPEILYEMMLQCWKYRPKQRPTFKEIIELLIPELEPEFKENSYFFSEGNKIDNMEYGDEEYLDDYSDGNQDDSHMPFISGEGASLGAAGGGPPCLRHSGNIDFVDTDYRYSSYPHNPVGASEPCDCILLQETKPLSGGGGQCPSDNNHRYSMCSNSAIGSSSNDGSKESSKSSDHSYNPINGINIPPSIANGHVPLHMQTTTSC